MTNVDRWTCRRTVRWRRSRCPGRTPELTSRRLSPTARPTRGTRLTAKRSIGQATGRHLVQSAVDRGTLSYESVDDARFVGTETFDGVTVDRYEYSDLSTWRQFGAGAFGSGGNVTVTDLTVVILVDSDGLARQTAWTLTGETDTAKRSQSTGARDHRRRVD